MMKCLVLYLVGALLPAANAQAAGGTSLCTISNSVDTASLSGSSFTNAVAGIGGFVCEDEESNIGTQIAVHVVASSITDMLSDVDISCLLLEDNAALEQITGQAERGADAAGLAIGAVMSSEEVCVDCVAKAELFVDEVVLQVREAILAVLSQLDLALTRLEIRRAIRRGLEQALDDAISGASLTVRNAAVSNCGGSGTIVRREGSSFARCSSSVSGVATAIETDAVVQLVAETRAYACEDSTARAPLDFILTRTATALADAVAQVQVFCETSGNAMGCASGRVGVRAAARAQAEAFASGLAEAGTCKCNESISLSSTAFGEVFAEATATAFASVCSVGTNSSFQSVFVRALDEQNIAAVARVMAEAVAVADDSGDTCQVNVSVDPCTGFDSCAADTDRCRGEGVTGTLPCCSNDFVCMRRSSQEARCRPRDAPIPSFYNGTIEVATAQQQMIELPSICAPP